MRRRWRTAAAAAWGVLAACAPPPEVPRPPVVRGPLRPTQALVPDLDVVVRIDVKQLRATLGPEPFQRVAGDGPTGTLLAAVFERSDTAWIALRPASRLDLLDTVIALEGRYRGFDPQRLDGGTPWSSPQDRGDGLAVHERDDPPGRSEPARIYRGHDDVLVLASLAEIDAVERAIRNRGAPGTLVPPERGVISFAARPGPLVRWLHGRAAKAAAILRGALRFQGYAGLDEAGLKGRLEIEYPEAARASRVARAAELLRREVAKDDRFAGVLARALAFEAQGASTIVRLDVPREVLLALTTGGRARSRPGADGGPVLDPAP